VRCDYTIILFYFIGARFMMLACACHLGCSPCFAFKIYLSRDPL
jgi:hypothetical protein